jgi:glycosyltransferase involved in cell wall biosynthesis
MSARNAEVSDKSDARASGLISCLMVTQTSRLGLARRAIGDFVRQSDDDRELVIVHASGDDTHRALLALADAHPGAPIRVVAQARGVSLGRLRNAAVDAAAGRFVCQWDDDDRYHPLRLSLQRRALAEGEAEFCFLVDQLHAFPAEGSLFWDDWDREAYPLNLVQPSLFGLRAAMPRYADLGRGEDTALVFEILRAGRRIARLREHGWCYVYVYHGDNVWDEGRHQAISRAKHFTAARLLRLEKTLRARLAEYDPPLPELRMPCATGEILLAGQAAVPA